MRSWLRVFGLIIVGLIAGAALGLYLGWVAWPTEFTDANPAVLQESYQRDYVQMIASAYALDEDLDSARSRINSLGQNGEETLFLLMLDTILRADDEAEIRRLVFLAADLGLHSPAMEPYLSDPPLEPGNG
jgi:hypothetical protein